MITADLKWDSSFFHRSIFSVTLERTDPVEQWQEALFSCPGDLIYLKFPDDLSAEQKDFLKSLHPAVSVTNITFEKFSCPADGPEETAIQTVSCANELLYSMASDCGRFSRFYLDPVLCSDYFRLYRQWLENAFTKEHWHCITYSEGDETVGLCVFSRDHENAGHIELLAVNERFQNKKIGQRLLQSAENALIRMYGISKIFVVTQECNIPAWYCYRKFGFVPCERTHIFHLWRKHEDPVQ